MKLLFTSDWQTSVGNLQLCQQMHKHILGLVKQHHVDAVINLGDLKDSLNPVDQRVLNFWATATQDICKRCEFLVLIGNHDRIAVADGTDTLAPILLAAGAQVFSQPEEYHGMYFVPFMRDVAALKQAFAERRSSKVLLFHAEVHGADFGQYVSTSKLTLDDLHAKRYRQCFGGHIHKHQRLTSNAWYVGSPFCQDWGEANQVKGVMLYDTDEDRVQFLTSPIPGLYDASVPGFHKPATWEGATVRVQVRVNASYTLAQAQQEAERKYKGARIVIAPYRLVGTEDAPMVDVASSDEMLLAKYIETHAPPFAWMQEVAATYLLAVLQETGVLVRQQGGLKLTHVAAKNVLTFQEPIAASIAPGLTVITGRNEDWGDRRSNGAGKSSLLNLPAIALFGRTLKGQQHDAWCNRFNKDTAVVQLCGQLSDGRSIEITRTRRPLHLRFMVDSKDCSSADAQKQIEAQLGITWDMLTSVLYIDQAHINRLLAGTDKDRKTLFAQFLNLERFSKALDKVRAEIRKVRAALSELLVEVEKAEAVCVEAEASLQALGKAATTKQDMLHARDKFQAAAKAKAEAKVARKQWEEENSIDGLLEGKERCAAELVRAQEQVNTLRFAKRDGNVCPTCGQRIQGRSQEHIAQELQEWRSKESAAQRAFDAARDAWGDGSRVWNKLVSAVQCAEYEYEGTKKLYTSIKERWQTVEQHKRRLYGRIKRYRKTVVRMQQAAKEHEVDLELLAYCEKVVSREGLPAFLAYTICPKLNAAAEEYSQLFTEGQIKVRFVLDDTDIDVQVENDHGGATLGDQSQGETRMASLVTAFALRESLVPYNLLVLDEPGEGLDSTNARTFARGLKQVVSRFGSLWVTSHNPHILAELSDADQHWEVVKKDRISRVEVV